MKTSILLTGVALIGFVAPALADSSYYVVQGPDKHCQVVDQRPEVKTTTVVGPDGVIYKTRTEAMDAMKTITVCQ